ncbi:MAG: hypothetical protein M3281_03450 [Chloroflexota bacterium]|nr:hypothetical protein [Chloroflexota bacterium]
MNAPDEGLSLADLADGTVPEPEWAAWSATHPELSDQVQAARQVRALLAELRAGDVELPAGFEVLLMERVRRGDTLWGLVDLWLAGFGHALFELLNGLLSAQPSPEPAQ